MTFQDWLTDTKHRYHTQPPGQATRESLNALRLGLQRRTLAKLGRTIWNRSDWDILIILDACRHDTWRNTAPQYHLPKHGWAWSNAACSIDWLQRNLTNHPTQLPTTGYVTANPFADHNDENAQSADLADQPLAYFAPVYKDHHGPVGDTGIETVPPEVVTDYAIDAWRNHDLERLVVHYMQPHQPYRSRPDWTGVNKNLKGLVTDQLSAEACAWQRCRRDEIGEDELLAAVQDNLEWVLDDVVNRLLPNVTGRVVFSADHGNAAGMWGEWGHPPGGVSPAVRRVPWVSVVEHRDEETVVPDVDRGVLVDGGGVGGRLEALGYA